MSAIHEERLRRRLQERRRVHRRELEEELARFKGTEAALLFQSGFTANAGTVVAAILTRDDVVVSDELNHASIIDGCRLSGATKKIYRHRDVAHARALLEESRGARLILLITDGVFSMDGDIAPLPDLCALAREYGAIMMVDDAHASGVLGRAGRGTVDHFGLHGQVDIQVGTLSKAFATMGGYVAGSRTLIEYLMHRARPLLFSTSHPPAVAAAALEAVRLVQEEPELIERLWENTRLFKSGLRALGFNTGSSETPITPVISGRKRPRCASRTGCSRRASSPWESPTPQCRGGRRACARSSRPPTPVKTSSGPWTPSSGWAGSSA